MPFDGIEPWQIPTYSDGYRPDALEQFAVTDENLMDCFLEAESCEQIDPETQKMLKDF